MMTVTDQKGEEMLGEVAREVGNGDVAGIEIAAQTAVLNEGLLNAVQKVVAALEVGAAIE